MRFPRCLFCGREAAKVLVAMLGGDVGHVVYACGSDECDFQWEFDEGVMSHSATSASGKPFGFLVEVPDGCLAVFGELA